MNKIFAILITCSLMYPVLAIEEQDTSGVLTPENSIETISEEDTAELNSNSQQTAETDVIAPKEELPARFKEPISKKKIAKKFLIAMLCVAGTSVLLYGTLSIYNKIREGLPNDIFLQSDNKPTALDTPQDISEAVKSFVEKTRWE